jgi:hypothetical protein
MVKMEGSPQSPQNGREFHKTPWTALVLHIHRRIGHEASQFNSDDKKIFGIVNSFEDLNKVVLSGLRIGKCNSM